MLGMPMVIFPRLVCESEWESWYHPVDQGRRQMPQVNWSLRAEAVFFRLVAIMRIQLWPFRSWTNALVVPGLSSSRVFLNEWHPFCIICICGRKQICKILDSFGDGVCSNDQLWFLINLTLATWHCVKLGALASWGYIKKKNFKWLYSELHFWNFDLSEFYVLGILVFEGFHVSFVIMIPYHCHYCKILELINFQSEKGLVWFMAVEVLVLTGRSIALGIWREHWMAMGKQVGQQRACLMEEKEGKKGTGVPRSPSRPPL